jgi:hypothetical protein
MSTWNLEGTIRHVLICNGGSCLKMGAEEVTTAIRSEISAVGADHSYDTHALQRPMRRSLRSHRVPRWRLVSEYDTRRRPPISA